MMVLTVAWTVGWTALFYVAVWTQPRWIARYPKSTKEHENDPYWCTRQIVGILHAVVVCIGCIPALCNKIFQGPERRFRVSHNVFLCDSSGLSLDSQADAPYNMGVAMVGMAFTTFTISDLFFLFFHVGITWDYLFHHLAFIACGVIIRYNCCIPLQAAILLSMEVSTPFLNYMMFVRNRGDSFDQTIKVCGILFMISFVIFRLILNPYGAIDLIINREYALREVPAWEGWFLIVALTAGAILQIYWAKPIVKKFFEMKNALAEKESPSPYRKINGSP